MENVFPPIDFNEGLNILFAQVKKPKEDDKDSHNLGKTLLIHLIDFMLLKGFNKGHFLFDNKILFNDFVFFLEIQLNEGGYATVKRGIENNTKISIKLHNQPQQNFIDLAPADWDYDKLPFDKAVQTLNRLLHLHILGEYSYRKGISYLLRTQNDYSDVFQLSKFIHGKHSEWKPYIAMLLGFNHDLIKTKYQLDEEIQQKRQYRANYEKESGASLEKFDKIKGLIEIKRSETEELRNESDRFNFYAEELKINAELVNTVESEIALLNDRLYTIDYEIESIIKASENSTNFDTNKVSRLFSEVQLNFPTQLKKSYEELLAFYRKVSDERNRRLSKRKQELIKERGEVLRRLESLNVKRQEFLSILHEEDSFRKFKAIQREIGRKGAEIARLEAELGQIDVISKNDREIQELIEQRNRIINQIRDNVNAGNDIYLSVRKRFNAIIKGVLELPALLSTTLNAEGNIEFEANIVEDESSAVFTSEGKGTSYKKLLCAAFDMAVLVTYREKSFYRFVYHDGILEGLDNRKKRRFLSVVRRFCDEYKLQYIMTVIDADVPRDEDDIKIQFQLGTIIRTFHEEGDDGRLFRMPKF